MAFGFPGDAAQSFDLWKRLAQADLARQAFKPQRAAGLWDAYEAGMAPTEYAADAAEAARAAAFADADTNFMLRQRAMAGLQNAQPALGAGPQRLALPAAGQTTLGTGSGSALAEQLALPAGSPGGALVRAGAPVTAPSTLGPATAAAADSAGASAARASMFGQLFNGSAWKAGQRATGRAAWMSYGPNAVANEAGVIGRFAPGTVGRGGAYALAGQIAANLSQKAWNDPNSGADNALATGLAGAGLGAGVGSMILPGFGTAIGGALGGAGGAIYGALRAGHQDKDYANAQKQGTKKLNELMGQLNLTSGTQDQLRQQYAIQSVLARQSDNPVEAQKQILAQLTAQLPQVATQEASVRSAAKDALATQSVIAQFMQPYLDKVTANADLEAGMYQEAASSAPSQALRDALALRAQTARSGAARSVAGWSAAGQTAPMYAVSQQTGASPATIAQLLAQG